MDGKKIDLITPPIEYRDDEENLGGILVKPPCKCGECGNTVPEKQWPDPNAEVNDTD